MKNFFKNLKITGKLMVVLGVFLLFLTVFGIAFFLQLTYQEKHIIAECNERMQNYEKLVKIQNSILESQHVLYQMVSAGNAAAMKLKNEEKWKRLKTGIGDAENVIQEFLKRNQASPGQTKLYQELLSGVSGYREWALKTAESAGQDNAAAAGYFITADIKYSKVKDSVEKLKNFEIDFSKATGSSSIQQSVMIFISVLAAFIIVLVLISFYAGKRIIRPLQNIVQSIKGVVDGDFTKKVEVPSGDEIGDMCRYFNLFEEQMSGLLKKIKETSNVLINAIQGLSVSSQEISATSALQAAGVKEIVSTMEDSNLLAQEMLKSISEVVKIALKTKSNVETGVSYVKNSLVKMEEINEKNMDTIHGIRLLGEQIENIWDIVNIINGIVDQTKIIAFNASLEASSASEGGKNFQIVASEIKRLADNTMASTKEIKSKINEIQHASNNLVIVSEDGTERIKEGWELSQKLEAVFGDILNSAEITAKSSETIEVSIKQQASSFEQIFLTLKEISSGIESFVSSTKHSSHTAESLRDMADSLNKMVEKYTLD